MANLIAKLEGQDKLSPTLEKVKKKVAETGAESSKLDRIKEKFEKIQNSTAPLKKRLADVKKLLAEMNLDGLSNDGLYTELAQQAGAYADALGDASAATKQFADDNLNLKATAQGFQVVTGAASTLTGAMSFLGIENDNVQQAMLKVQSAIAMCNGVTTIANALNKDSALILKMRQLATVGAATTTGTFTALLSKHAVVEALVSAKQKISTAVQTAWNVAKAIGMAMLGNFTGLALLAVGGIVAMAAATQSDTEETEKNTEAKGQLADETNKLKDIQANYEKTISDQSGKLVGQYKALQIQWNRLTSDTEKATWLKENKSKFEQLGFSVESVTDAEDFFNKNTAAVVNAMKKRAKAMAAYNMVVEANQNLMRLQNQKIITFTYEGEKGGEDWKKQRDKAQSEYQQAKRNAEQAVKDAENLYARILDEEAAANAMVAQYQPKPKEKTTTKTSGGKGGGKSGGNKPLTDKDDDKSLKFAEDMVKQLESKRIEIPIDETKQLADNQKKIAKWKKEIEKRKAVIEASIVANDDGSIAYARKALNQFEEMRISIPIDETKTLADNQKKIDNWKKELEKRKAVIEANLTAKDDGSFQYAMDAIEKLREIRLNVDFESEKSLAENDEKIKKWKQEVEKRKAVIEATITANDDGSIEYAKQAIEQLREIRLNIDSETSLADNQAKIDSWMQKLEKRKITITANVSLSENSLEYAEDMLSKAKAALNSIDLAIITDEDLAAAKAQVDKWQKEVESREIKLGIKEVETPKSTASIAAPEKKETFDKGSIDDLRESLQNARNIISQIKSDYADGLIDSTTAKSQIDEINAKLAELGLKPIELHVEDDGTILTAQEELEKTQQQIESMLTATDSIGQSFSSIGNSIGGAEGALIEFTGQTLSSITQMLPQIAALIGGNFAQAMSSGTASAAALPFPANIAAIASIVATIAGIASQAKSMKANFADGGIVQGGSYHGDKILAGLNAGEMILNKRQQASLFNLLDSTIGTNAKGGNVEFKISGSTLKGVLRNYDAKMGKLT